MDNNYNKNKEKENESNCRIEIEDSIVVIICDEIEINKLKDCIKTVLEAKGNKN